jgi:hypothetical protein
LSAGTASTKDESASPATAASASSAATGCPGTPSAKVRRASEARRTLYAISARGELPGGWIEFSESDGLLPIVQLSTVEIRRVGAAIDRNRVRLCRLDRKTRRKQTRHVASLFSRRCLQRRLGIGVGLDIEGLEPLTFCGRRLSAASPTSTGRRGLSR